MRRSLFLFLAAGLAHAVYAQTEAPADGSGSSSNSFDGLLIRPSTFSTTAAGDTVSAANAQKSGPAPESRSPAQLQAILAGYVGHWTGNYVVTAMTGPELSNLPIDVVYVMEKDKNGRSTLVGTTTYQKKGKQVSETTRSWVDKGQIYAEISHDDIVEKFFARTRGPDLVWFTHDLNKGVTDFSMTESLRLTADGGTLTSKGFQAVPGSQPPVLVIVTSKLNKQPQ